MDTNMVGPVLEAGDEARAVLLAIRAANAPVSVWDRGSYWRVLVPGRCEVARQDIERIAGKSFRFPQDLERVMPAFSGRLQIDGERAVWALSSPKDGS